MENKSPLVSLAYVGDICCIFLVFLGRNTNLRNANADAMHEVASRDMMRMIQSTFCPFLQCGQCLISPHKSLLCSNVPQLEGYGTLQAIVRQINGCPPVVIGKGG